MYAIPRNKKPVTTVSYDIVHARYIGVGISAMALIISLPLGSLRIAKNTTITYINILVSRNKIYVYAKGTPASLHILHVIAIKKYENVANPLVPQ